MVTVITRPQGHKIIDQAIAATITEQYAGEAIVNFPAHGLSTGDFVYITSDIDEYNGFWYVTVANADYFKISEGATTDFVEYYQDAEIDYYQTQEHDWNSVFLPIVYKCTNNRWPVNTVDTARTISSFTDDNGFTDVQASGNLKLVIQALEFVKISGSSDESLNSVWQIVEVVTTSRVVLNLPYESSSALVGATIQYYYNNYQVKVKVFAGLPSTHPWVAKKPYSEVAELSLTPDDDNQVMFSVSDYIKIKVAIKNNLTLFSLPLNLDAFTGFYISTTETYDDSDGYTLTTNESQPFTDDTFEGYAIAGKLPFKNLYSGDYADYVYTSGSPALWLTNHDRLLAVEGYYFDVSFIKNITSEFLLRIIKYVGDYGVVEDVQYTDQGIGVYRLPITPDANYDSFCVTVYANGDVELDNNDFANNPGPGINWTLGATPSVIGTILSSSDLLWIAYPFIPGISYSISLTYTCSVTIAGSLSVQITNDSFVIQFNGSTSTLTSGSNTINDIVIFTATASTTRIAIDIDFATGGTVTLNSMTVTVNELQITEEICIDILETCESINQFTQQARRLLEDGGYRLLE